MRVIMPFFDLGLFHRYEPQLTAIAENLTTLTLLYIRGEPTTTHPNIRFHRVNYPHWVPKKLLLPYISENTFAKLDPETYDLVYVLSGRWQQYTAYNISLAHSKPLIIRLRGDDKEVTKSFSLWKRAVYNLLWEKRIETTFRHASAIIPIANHLKSITDQYGLETTETIPNGVNLNQFTPTAPPTTPTISCITRLSPEKGSALLKTVIDATPNTHYIIAGPIQQEWNTPINAELTGNIPFNKIHTIYQACNLVIIPSKMEGFPNSLLEAYASGRPIIATSKAIPNECKVFGYVTNDYNEMIRIINNVNRDELNRLGLMAREYVEKYSWANYGKNMATQFRSVCT